MIKKKTYILLLFMMAVYGFSFCQNDTLKSDNFTLTTTNSHFVAGSSIVLQFSTTTNKVPALYCATNYGSSMIKATHQTTNQISYAIPAHFSNKSGIINWQLVSSNLSGTISIQPRTKVTSMETYLGPPSIEAGGRDFTMMVVIPTDSLDNPLKEDTPVQLKYQFLANETTNTIKTEDLIAFRNIYSPNNSGRMILSSETYGRNSKEYDVNVVPAIPTNFTIAAKRNHNYADGNQITSFTTSIIRDSLGNVVSDGTYVNFFIRNKKQGILKTFGTTIQGIATGKMIHPDAASEWTIKAYVEGISESNSIRISYQQVITDFEILFSKNNRTITVGPLISFMEQMIPDGLQVSLSVYQKNKHIKTTMKTSKEGFVKFILKEGLYKKGTYDFTILTAGISKKIQGKKLW